MVFSEQNWGSLMVFSEQNWRQSNGIFRAELEAAKCCSQSSLWGKQPVLQSSFNGVFRAILEAD